MQSVPNLLRIKLDTTHLPHLEWANDLMITVPRNLGHQLTALISHQQLTPSTLNRITKNLTESALKEIRLRAAFTNSPPMASRFAINYQRVPALLRDIIAVFVGGRKRADVESWASFPTWPVDLSADFIADFGNHEPSPFKEGFTPVLLTHNLDSPQGLKNVVRYFVDMEEAVGACSAHYVIPHAWKIDHGLLDEVFARGHEIGVHGFDRRNQTPFLSSPKQKNHLSQAVPLVERYKIMGFRAPSLLRTKKLLQNLGAFYRYDSSVPTSGGMFPVPNNGCASARPFKLEGVWEIPLSIPSDVSLMLLGFSRKEILKTWIDCAELIAKSGGVVNLLTHCEFRFSGRLSMRETYRDFLNYLAQDGKFKFMLPRDVLGVFQKY